MTEKWLALERESSQALAMMAHVESRQGNLAAAVEFFQKAADLEQNPEQKASHLKSLESIRSALSRRQPDPARRTEAVSPLQAAVDAMNDDQWSDVIKILEKLYPTLPEGADKAQVELMLAIAHFNSGNLKEARIYVKRLLARDPADTRAQELLKATDKIFGMSPGFSGDFGSRIGYSGHL